MDDWIEWSGGECPVPPKTSVFYLLRDERRDVVEKHYCRHGTFAMELRWTHTSGGSDIIAYRVIQETPIANT